MAIAGDHGDGEDGGFTGIGVDDLPGLMRALFDQCVGDARATVDPAADFDGFVDELWKQTASAFGLVRRDWPADADKPWLAALDEQRGLAEAVLEGQVEPGELPT